MKKRRDVFTRIVAGATVLAVAAFAGVTLYSRAANPFSTARAARMTVRNEITASGYIVREEAAMPGVAELTAPELRDGEKAYTGQLVATVYTSGADEATLARIREYKRRVSALRDSIGRGVAEQSRQCEIAVQSLAEAIAARDFSRADELSIAAESMLAAGAENITPEAEIARLEAEIDALNALLRGGTGVYAPKAGVFSQSPDGYEHITPGALTEITPSGLRGLFETPQTSGSCVMVYGIRWYLALVLPTETAADVRGQSRLRVTAPRMSGAEYVMDIVSVGKPENGECVVTLSCGSQIYDTLGQRYVTAHLLLDEDTGYAVPKNAVRLDEDGQTQIYVAVSRSAVRIDIDILRELGQDAYLIEVKLDYGLKKDDPEDVKKAKEALLKRNTERAPYLRDGVEVVTRANDLYDGKVLR